MSAPIWTPTASRARPRRDHAVDVSHLAALEDQLSLVEAENHELRRRLEESELLVGWYRRMFAPAGPPDGSDIVT